MKPFAALGSSLLLLCLLAVSALDAQTTTGSIVGSVTDPSGLAIVGAAVTLVNTATGGQRSTQTTGAGDFVFSGVDPGPYSVAVTSKGFKKAERTSLNLTASETLSVGVTDRRAACMHNVRADRC